MALQWGGQGCMKPCWRHWNVMRLGSGRAEHAPRADHVEIACHEPHRFRVWGDAALRDAVGTIIEARERVNRGELPQARLNEIQQAYGFSATREGLLADRPLCDVVRPLSTMRYDWMHTLLSSGPLLNETWALLSKGAELEVATQEDLHAYLSLGWRGPRNWDIRARPPHKLFDTRGRHLNQEHEGIKCSASECIGLYGLVRHYVESVMPRDARLDQHKRCFLLVCRAVDVLLRVKRRLLLPAPAATQLRSALVEHLALHKSLYGDASVKPTNHWLFDIADFLERDTFLFDAFVIERIHLRARAVANHACRLDVFEVAVLNGLVNAQCNAARHEHAGPSLIGRSAPFPGVPGAYAGRRLETCGAHVSVDDIVRLGGAIGTVRVCLIEDGNTFIVVDEHVLVRVLSDTCTVCSSASGQRSVWRPNDVELCSAWRHADDGANLVALHSG